MFYAVSDKQSDYMSECFMQAFGILMFSAETFNSCFHVWAWEVLDDRGNCVAQAVVRGPTLENFCFEAPVSSLGCRNYWSQARELR